MTFKTYLPGVRIWDRWLMYFVANCNVSILDSLRSGGSMGIIPRSTSNAELTLNYKNSNMNNIVLSLIVINN